VVPDINLASEKKCWQDERDKLVIRGGVFSFTFTVYYMVVTDCNVYRASGSDEANPQNNASRRIFYRAEYGVN